MGWNVRGLAIIAVATTVLVLLLARRGPAVAVVYDAIDADLVGSST
jgi:hypothetical protein